jgi:hypothetical protein
MMNEDNNIKLIRCHLYLIDWVWIKVLNILLIDILRGPVSNNL